MELDVTVAKIEDLDGPLGNDSATAKKDLAALEKDVSSTAMDSAFSRSYQLISGKYLVGKTYVVLGQLQVCDVKLVKTAVLYNGPYQIKISLAYKGIDYLRSANPDYFTSDSANCGTGKTWKSQDDFYTALQGGKTDESTQDWLNTFKKIMSSYSY
jgi:hypothetical protein